MKKTLRLIAAKGRRVPIHPSVAAGPGGALLIVGETTAVDLPDCSFVRRRMRAGDLIPAPSTTTRPIDPPNPGPSTVPVKES